jgi:hypothetical protein
MGPKQDRRRKLEYQSQAAQVEYWLLVQLYPIADEPLDTHLAELNQSQQRVLIEMTPMISQHLLGQEIEDIFKIRYPSNTLRVWLTPKACWDAGYRSLAEASGHEETGPPPSTV